MNNEHIEKHPSYATLRFSRISSGKPRKLFGSSIEHKETIRMTVKPAYVERELSSDWIHSYGQELIEIEMSHAQFAEAITSMNLGSGVPVTLVHVNENDIPSPDYQNKRTQFEEEFEDKIKQISDNLQVLMSDTNRILNSKKAINKGDREVIRHQVERLQQEIQSNIPFINKLFNEQMDKTVHEAKSEVEAFTQSKVLSLGLAEIEKLKALEHEKSLDK